MGIQQPSNYYDELYSTSTRYNGDFILAGYFPQWAFCVSLLMEFYNNFKNILGNSLSLLDIGCGPGQFAQLLFQLFHFPSKKIDFTYTGVDFSKTAIEIALKNEFPYNFYFFNTDIFKQIEIFNSNNSRFSVITCFEMFEHIENDTDVFCLFNEGQFFIFSVPMFDDPAHVRFFKTHDEVLNRYNSYFSLLKVELILNIFICYGFLKNPFDFPHQLKDYT